MLTLRVYKSSDLENFISVTASKMTTVRSLKECACEKLGLQVNKVRIWDYHNQRKVADLEKYLGRSIAYCNIVDKNEILIEEKAEGEGMTLRIYKSSDLENFISVTESKLTTVRSLKKRACEKLGLQVDKVRIWDYFGQRKGADLEKDLGRSLDDWHIFDKNDILLEEKAEQRSNIETSMENACTIEMLSQEKVQLLQTIEMLNEEKDDQLVKIGILNQEKAEQQRKIEILGQENAHTIEMLSQEKVQLQHMVEMLNQEKDEQLRTIGILNQEKAEQQRTSDILGQENAHAIETLDQEKAELLSTIGTLSQEKAELLCKIEKMNQERAEQLGTIGMLNHEKAEQQSNIETLMQEKAKQQHTIEILRQENARAIEALSLEKGERLCTIEMLSQEKAEQLGMIETLNQEKADQQRNIDTLKQENAWQQGTIEALNQEKTKQDCEMGKLMAQLQRMEIEIKVSEMQTKERVAVQLETMQIAIEEIQKNTTYAKKRPPRGKRGGKKAKSPFNREQVVGVDEHDSDSQEIDDSWSVPETYTSWK